MLALVDGADDMSKEILFYNEFRVSRGAAMADRGRYQDIMILDCQ